MKKALGKSSHGFRGPADIALRRALQPTSLAHLEIGSGSPN